MKCEGEGPSSVIKNVFCSFSADTAAAVLRHSGVSFMCEAG